MSIFGTIMSKVFGEHHPAASASPADQKPAADTSTAPPTTSAAEKSEKSNTWEQAPTNALSGGAASTSGAAASAPAAGASAPATAPSTVDIAEKLDGMESGAGQKLDWRHSIVDLMKLLGMDSSLSARKELAKELHYTGDTEDYGVDEHVAAQGSHGQVRPERRNPAAGSACVLGSTRRIHRLTPAPAGSASPREVALSGAPRAALASASIADSNYRHADGVHLTSRMLMAAVI